VSFSHYSCFFYSFNNDFLIAQISWMFISNIIFDVCTQLEKIINLLTLKNQTTFFGNIGILDSSLQIEFLCFSLKFSHNMWTRSSSKTQQFSWFLTTWLKIYCMVCNFFLDWVVRAYKIKHYFQKSKFEICFLDLYVYLKIFESFYFD